MRPLWLLKAVQYTLQIETIVSPSFDPWHNLALEESLLNGITNNQVVLYLWQNDNTVVVGRNQNAWKECRWRELESSGGKLARRLSGGGAVFHDLGNINFSFVVHRDLYDLDKQLSVIFQALKSLGIDAEFSGRNDLTVSGRKFSGNAFHFSGQSALHHGTILVSSDTDKIQHFLQVSEEKLASKGITSIRARIVNLIEMNSKITVENVSQNLQRSFVEIYGDPSRKLQFQDLAEDIEQWYRKHASWQWRYGDSPEFNISFQNRFTWGEIEMGLNLNKGHIAKTTIYSDIMDSGIIQNIAEALNGVPLQLGAIDEALKSIPKTFAQERIILDLRQWLSTKDKMNTPVRGTT
jgi:lipoate-protein ligase A